MDVLDSRMTYEDGGDQLAPPIVLRHGTPHLTDHGRVIGVHLIGMGASVGAHKID